MKRWWWIVAALFLSLGLNLGLLVSFLARGPAPIKRWSPDSAPVEARPPRLPPREQLDELVERRLGLAGEERDRFVALHRGFLERTIDLRLELERVRYEIKAELVSEEPRREEVEALLDQAASLQIEMERTFVDHVFQAREILDGRAERAYLALLGRLARGPRGPDPTGARDRRRR